MAYPLFYPSGKPGWYYGIPHVQEHATAQRTTVTLLQFHIFRWADRGHFNPLLHGGFLTQQKMVDDYLAVESSRLDFIRKNQTKCRVDCLRGLYDHVYNQPPQSPQIHNPGIPFYLPSSFQGSRRNMTEAYHDAMSIVRILGKPDLFVTFTCNEKWPEITSSLKAGQIPSDRPDLLSRVFNIYLKDLIADITGRHVLGRCVSHIYVIEFQKRGKPHAHILLIFDDTDKLRTAADIDSLISAQIPDPQTSPVLHEIVKTKMMHGPCGVLNAANVCMDNGTCPKDFPKSFQPSTSFSDNGYQRVENDRTVVVKNQELDNRWVVPYNPYLLLRYDAHINVEACVSIKSVKYIYKYVYKGHDSANIELSSDELKNYLDLRYVCAPEAAYRLFEYKMRASSHCVYKLPIHLPNMQYVYFQLGNEEEAVQRALTTATKLTAWFVLNASSEHARQYLYTDIPLHFSFANNKWKERRRAQKVVTRLTHVFPPDLERYHLRILLLHVAGATSFDDLLTYENRHYDNFQEACKARHFIDDDSAWSQTLTEASNAGFPSCLREMFSYILLFCQPSDHRHHLIEDHVRSGCTDSSAEQKALHHINSILSVNRKSLTDYNSTRFFSFVLSSHVFV